MINIDKKECGENDRALRKSSIKIKGIPSITILILRFERNLSNHLQKLGVRLNFVKSARCALR